MQIIFNHCLVLGYLIGYLILHFFVPGVLGGIAFLQADLKCRHDDLKTTRREIVALRKMLRAILGELAHCLMVEL